VTQGLFTRIALDLFCCGILYLNRLDLIFSIVQQISRSPAHRMYDPRTPTITSRDRNTLARNHPPNAVERLRKGWNCEKLASYAKVTLDAHLLTSQLGFLHSHELRTRTAHTHIIPKRHHGVTPSRVLVSTTRRRTPATFCTARSEFSAARVQQPISSTLLRLMRSEQSASLPLLLWKRSNTPDPP
jgi:hypothetical protein